MQRLISERVEFDPNGGCWLWSGTMGAGGYGTIGIAGKTRLAHRVSYAAFVGHVGEWRNHRTGTVVMHKCDVTVCVNPNHLVVGTQIDNIRDRDSKGRRRHDEHRQGESHHMVVLNDEIVRNIRTRYSAGEKQAAMAEEFGVTQSNISAVVRRRTWRHI